MYFRFLYPTKIMKKILVYAYLNKNLGDDLFIHMLAQRYPDHMFYVTKRKSYARAVFKGYRNLKFSFFLEMLDKLMKLEIRLQKSGRIKKDYFSAFFKKYFMRFDAAVYITGSAFVQRKSGQAMEGIDRLRKKKELSKRFFLIGANFGPYEDAAFRNGYNEVFSSLDDSCFRDTYSVTELGAAENKRYAPDIVFNLDPTPYLCKSEQKNILVSVIDCERFGRPVPLKKQRVAYETKVAQICKKLHEKGYRITLMSFCDMQKDDASCRRIANRIRNDIQVDVDLYSYNGNMTEALKKFAQADGIIASRFHAMILGWVFGKTVLPLVYDHKMETVIRDFDFSGLWENILSIEQLDADKAASYLTGGEQMNIERIKKEATKQFAAFEQFLKS